MYVALWMALIFTLSSVPDLRSGFQPLWDLVLRKIAHAGEFAVLAWLVFRALRKHDVSLTIAGAWSVVVTVVYAASDEYHQTFVPGRNGSLLDVAVDSAGGLAGALIVMRRR